jgi:hypothetical protein
MEYNIALQSTAHIASGLARAGSVGRRSSPTESSGLIVGLPFGRDRKKVVRTGPTEMSSVFGFLGTAPIAWSPGRPTELARWPETPKKPENNLNSPTY